ncbi:MAG TPA: hypothetical protein VF070_41595 [Streptosporangiaceae bacterium]
MSKKRRTFALAVATAGLLSLSAPIASAATAGGPGDVGGLVNVSHNQVPIQVCNNKVPVNVLGVQVPVSDIAGALGLISPGGITAAKQDSSCHQASAQISGHHSRCHTCEQAAEMGYAKPDAARDPQAAPMALVPVGDEGDPGDVGGLVNVSHNQVPIQVCNNKVPVNVLGVQVPVSDIAAALGLILPGPTVAVQDSSCHQKSLQRN